MTPVLRCRKCGEWYTVQRTVPDVCPNCAQQASWTTDPVEPSRYWTPITLNDVRFLRAIKIQPFDWQDV